MTRSEILSEIRFYFDIDELVCPHTLAKWGEQSWQFLDTDYLHCLLVIRRDILKRAMWCNGKGGDIKTGNENWIEITEEGEYYCLVQDNYGNPITSDRATVYCLGKAGDFTVTGMTAEQARLKIKENAHLLPCNIRVEEGVSWLHFDVLPQYGVTAKVYGFKA